MAHTLERLRNAVQILSQPGEPRERLARAYRSELQYVDGEGLDPTLVYELEGLNDELTQAEAEGDLDTIDMSVQNLSDEEVASLTEQVKTLCDMVARETGEGVGC